MGPRWPPLGCELEEREGAPTDGRSYRTVFTYKPRAILAGSAPDKLSPNGKPRIAAVVTFNGTFATRLASRQLNAWLQSDGLRHAHGISLLRVMFWLSRASAPLWWDSNCASNDPLCVTLYFPLYSLFNLTNTGAHQAYCRGF